MKRLLTEIGMICIVLLAVYLAVFLPSLKKYRERATEILAANKEIETNVPVIIRSKQVKKELTLVSRDIRERERRMKTPPSSSGIAMLLRNLAEKMNLKILMDVGWTPIEKESKDKESQGEEPPWKGRYIKLEKTMTLQGGFVDIGRFLEAIEKMDGFARATKVLFQKKGDDESDLVVDLTIDMYDMREVALK